MSKNIALITGAAGGLGFTMTKFLLSKGFDVISIDNNIRLYFFGDDGNVSSNFDFLKQNTEFHSIDVRDGDKLKDIFKNYGSDITFVCHYAAQPSHDWAAKNPILDFDINARATLLLLELCREYCPDSPFVFSSTNKVYGDTPNALPLVEEDLRYDFHPLTFYGCKRGEGVDETMSIDDCTHSVFGASKVAADVMVQEYGRYFDMPTTCFRAGCMTGASHSGAELHGYLQYIVKCAITNKHYNIFGYKGKQVRDQIDFYDVCTAAYEFYLNPTKGKVYNMGGGFENSISILETIKYLSDKDYALEYDYVDDNRIGDHIVYYSNLARFKNDYPNWKIEKSVYDIIDDIVRSLEDERAS